MVKVFLFSHLLVAVYVVANALEARLSPRLKVILLFLFSYIFFMNLIFISLLSCFIDGLVVLSIDLDSFTGSELWNCRICCWWLSDGSSSAQLPPES